MKPDPSNTDSFHDIDCRKVFNLNLDDARATVAVTSERSCVKLLYTHRYGVEQVDLTAVTDHDSPQSPAMILPPHHSRVYGTQLAPLLQHKAWDHIKATPQEVMCLSSLQQVFRLSDVLSTGCAMKHAAHASHLRTTLIGKNPHACLSRKAHQVALASAAVPLPLNDQSTILQSTHNNMQLMPLMS